MDASRRNSHGRTQKAARARLSFSDSSATAITSPLPPRLLFSSLPALAHDIISSFLPAEDRLRMMETAPWVSRTYGACVKQLAFRHVKRDDNIPIQSILKRRPALVELTIRCCRAIKELAGAMAEGSCDKLQVLELGDLPPYSRGIRACLGHLFDALGNGACPNMIHLSLWFEISGNQADRDNAMKDLGEVLRSRTGKGCRGLKTLELHSFDMRKPFTVSALSPVLSSGACDKIEELRLESCELKGPASDALKEWLLRTKAPRLRAFTAYSTPADVIEALSSSPGVASGLQFLGLLETSPEAVTQLSVSIEQGAWRELKELSVALDGGVSNHLVSRLMEAIRVGALGLRNLYLFNWRMGAEGAKAVAQSLRDGACPRLEELCLFGGLIGDVGVMELVKAFVEGAPCNKTLEIVNLDACGMGTRGIQELTRAVTRGALPRMHSLQLAFNHFAGRDIMGLVKALNGRTGPAAVTPPAGA